jgi:hypothetical protein
MINIIFTLGQKNFILQQDPPYVWFMIPISTPPLDATHEQAVKVFPHFQRQPMTISYHMYGFQNPRVSKDGFVRDRSSKAADLC